VFGSSTSNQVLLVNAPPVPPPPPVIPPPSMFEAAFTLFIDAVELILSQHGFGPAFGLPSQSDILNSIVANLPFASVLGFPALSAGMNTANEALGNSGP